MECERRRNNGQTANYLISKEAAIYSKTEGRKTYVAQGLAEASGKGL